MKALMYSYEMKAILPHSLFFAPMEGITDETYRLVILKQFPEWDFMATDFLRVPASGYYTPEHVMEHYGKTCFSTDSYREKTFFQVLTSEKAFTQETVSTIHKLGFQWLDLNLGCPSKTVVAHKGGSFLLTDLPLLRQIIKTIRANFPHRFTCKMRVGFHDDKNLEDIVMLLQDEGVEAITIHARTRDDLYKGIANWDYLKRAVKVATIPIVGNGDIWEVSDINKLFDYTGCHSAMIGRGALKTPWLATLYKDGIFNPSKELHLCYLVQYFNSFIEALENENASEVIILKRLKSVSRYIFDHFSEAEMMKRNFMRTLELEAAKEFLGQISTQKVEQSLGHESP
ncbi:MAG: tRNA-dihydrouridine synthase family protein [Bacteriovoracaceae bacterium]